MPGDIGYGSQAATRVVPVDQRFSDTQEHHRCEGVVWYGGISYLRLLRAASDGTRPSPPQHEDAICVVQGVGRGVPTFEGSNHQGVRGRRQKLRPRAAYMSGYRLE